MEEQKTLILPEIRVFKDPFSASNLLIQMFRGWMGFHHSLPLKKDLSSDPK